MTSRRALLTALAVGNSAATSGASRMRLVPSANRAAYLPRTPLEKSYSLRISSRTRARFAGLLAFFIARPFPTVPALAQVRCYLSGVPRKAKGHFSIYARDGLVARADRAAVRSARIVF